MRLKRFFLFSYKDTAESIIFYLLPSILIDLSTIKQTRNVTSVQKPFNLYLKGVLKLVANWLEDNNSQLFSTIQIGWASILLSLLQTIISITSQYALFKPIELSINFTLRCIVHTQTECVPELPTRIQCFGLSTKNLEEQQSLFLEIVF